MDQIERGLPVAALDRLSDAIAPNDRAFRYRIVPRATYVRRKQRRRLSTEESARDVRLARVWSFALNVWKDEEEARAFMFREHPLLADRRPVDVALSSELGARLVEEALGRLAYGSAA
jgi:putative toxin-antitoxin system antitoxin component (TIGR02293 family)